MISFRWSWPVTLGVVSTAYVYYLIQSEAGLGPKIPVRIDATVRSLILLGFVIWFLLELYKRVMTRLTEVEATILAAVRPGHGDGRADLDPDVVSLTQRLVRKVTDQS